MLIGQIVGSYELDAVLLAGDAIRAHACTRGSLAAGAGRRVHQERAVPVPLLAAARDGRADAGVGLPAFGDDGEGRRVPAGAPASRAGGHRPVLLRGDQRRRGDAAGRRVERDLPARPQGPAGVLDDLAPGPDHAAVRPVHADGGGRRPVPHPQPRHVQGLAVHGRRHHRPRDRHPRHAPAGQPASATCPSPARWRSSPRLAMAGIPLLNGFLSKEMFFAEALEIGASDAMRDCRHGGGVAVRHLRRGLQPALRARHVLRRRPARARARAARAAALHERSRWRCWWCCAWRWAWPRPGPSRRCCRPAAARRARPSDARVQPGGLARHQQAAADEHGRHRRRRGPVLRAAPAVRPARHRRRSLGRSCVPLQRRGACSGWRGRFTRTVGQRQPAAQPGVAGAGRDCAGAAPSVRWRRAARGCWLARPAAHAAARAGCCGCCWWPAPWARSRCTGYRLLALDRAGRRRAGGQPDLRGPVRAGPGPDPAAGGNGHAWSLLLLGLHYLPQDSPPERYGLRRRRDAATSPSAAGGGRRPAGLRDDDPAIGARSAANCWRARCPRPRAATWST